MRILTVNLALPGPLRAQEVLLVELESAWGSRVLDRERALLTRLAKSSGVKSKHLAMNPEQYKSITSFTQRNQIFQEVAEDLGIKAVREASEAAGLFPNQLDAIFFTTVTGIAVPSIDSRIAGSLGFSENIKRIPMFGLGCVAGAAGIARVHDYLKAYPTHAAVLLAVELCSLTLQLEDLSPESIVASTLFGDGAAAVVCVGDDHPLAAQSRLSTVATRSRLYPHSRHIMGWDVGSHGFKILLDPGVPNIVEQYFADDVRGFLKDHQLGVTDIKSWISHPGGPKVLKAIESSLALKPNDLKRSWTQLESMGNLSSASVLAILKATIEGDVDSAKPGDAALMMAMGPGFCSEQVLCTWN
jgi:alkylresorcinol/alkylpyrone synthase